MKQHVYLIIIEIFLNTDYSMLKRKNINYDRIRSFFSFTPKYIFIYI